MSLRVVLSAAIELVSKFVAFKQRGAFKLSEKRKTLHCNLHKILRSSRYSVRHHLSIPGFLHLVRQVIEA